MCDAASRNTDEVFHTLLANCLAHGRRKFVDIASGFPEECREVLEKLRAVYRHDKEARVKGMTQEQRLHHHRQHSAAPMKQLHEHMTRQLDDHLVERNSPLGEAYRYLLSHWEPLTLFLRVPGAPLDNNICERTLKLAILHRKNALHFRTFNGALVSDVWMSLAHTAHHNGASAYDYLVAALRHPEQCRTAPANWMPWNYQQALAACTPPSEPPSLSRAA
jgi:hypothetical protein